MYDARHRGKAAVLSTRRLVFAFRVCRHALKIVLTYHNLQAGPA